MNWRVLVLWVTIAAVTIAFFGFHRYPRAKTIITSPTPAL